MHSQRPSGFILLPRLRVQHANAMSSPHTWGFPAPRTFLGFVEALQRRLFGQYEAYFDGVAIICHAFQPHVYQPNRRFHVAFTQTRNPPYLKRDGAQYAFDGTTPAIVEEGRAHMEVSLLIALREPPPMGEEEDFARKVLDYACTMRIAGGSVLPREASDPSAEWFQWGRTEDGQSLITRRLRRRLLPGFALVHRPDLLREQLEYERTLNPDASALDALLSLTSLHHVPTDEATQEPGRVKWLTHASPSWLVPIPIGYTALSDLEAPGTVVSARDETTPMRFVENLISLGQWLSPHRVDDLEPLLWRHGGSPEDGVYRTTNSFADHAALEDNQ